MEIDATLLDEAADFLIQGNEVDAARTLQACAFMGWGYNDSWMDGSRRLDAPPQAAGLAAHPPLAASMIDFS